jgi:4-hydroxybenzoate polyprenyltransferase
LGSKLTLGHRLVQSLIGIFKIADVPGWQKWSGAAFLGFAFALEMGNNFSLTQFQGLAIGVSLICCYNQSVNDCFDVDIDTMREKMAGKELVITNLISRKVALAATFSFLLFGLISAWFASTGLFAFCLSAAVLGTLYSAPPFRLKMIYPFSTLIQFVGCFLPFLAGIASISNVTLQTTILSSSFAVLAITHRFGHEMVMYSVDIQTGKKTVAVVKGLRITQMLLRLSFLVGIAELVVFLILGWLNIVFMFLLAVYVSISIVPSIWLRHISQPLRAIFTRILSFSSFILLLTILLLR